MVGMNLKALALGVALLPSLGLVASTAAHAENACNTEINQTVNDWRALKLNDPGKPAALSTGVRGHVHINVEVASMRYHLKAAQDLCAAGSDHEALLHLDVIRAFLKIPEIQHPTDHHYLFDDKSK